MSLWRIATQSLRHYWRSNLVIALGVAAATAVLTGALMVGDSMRTSLRKLTLERLGKIDEMLVSTGFFRQQLAEEISQLPEFKSHYQSATPLILFPNGAIEVRSEDSVRRAAQVGVLGITPEFWELGDSVIAPPEPLGENQVAINQALADDLGLTAAMVAEGSAELILRIPKPTQLPAESALGRKSDLVSSLIGLKVTHIVPGESLGQFALHPSQSNPRNIFVPISMLTDELAYGALNFKQDSEQCNAILFTAKNELPSAQETENLKSAIRPSYEDLGLQLTRARSEFDGRSVFDYWSISAERMVLPDELVTSIQKTGPVCRPVMTYLANRIYLAPDADTTILENGLPDAPVIPFSMVSAVDFENGFELNDLAGQPIPSLQDDEIVLNQWSAADLGAKVGDRIVIRYFLPTTTHGDETEVAETFKLAAIAKLTRPVEPFDQDRRGRIIPAKFDQQPTRANDPDLTPYVPGVTDVESIDDWSLPFPTDGVRPTDDDYWNEYRTTPKAFLSLKTGKRLWGSRFGSLTSLQVPFRSQDETKMRKRIADQVFVDRADRSFNLVPIKRNGLAASAGSTPFDVLFLALSMFVIAAALILVSLLFRLALAQRTSEMGLLLATGFPSRRVSRLWLCEMMLVALIGVAIGLALGVGYAWLMIFGLKTWWLGAISRPFLELTVSGVSLAAGGLIALVMSLLTIMASVRRAGKSPVRSILSGNLESLGKQNRRGGLSLWIAIVSFLGAIGLAGLATQLGGEPQAGAFMGAGFLVLLGGLLMVRRYLGGGSASDGLGLNLTRLAQLTGRRAPLRSTLTIGLVAVASFLIMAVSSFRLQPTEKGTAGFDWVAKSNQPVFANLNTATGQGEVLTNQPLPQGTQVFSLRYKPGEDASCNNLYQSTQPQVLALGAELRARLAKDPNRAFDWAGSTATTDEQRADPWTLLNEPQSDGAIPVVIDKNTANYSLKIFAPGGIKEVTYDSGETVKFRVVGFLANSILQGSLLVSEENFRKAFPDIPGYRYFLIDEPGEANETDAKTAAAVLEEALSDEGFDAQSATRILAGFMQVQNTYISTFQTLGALGLLLGTFGLAAVQIRSIIERRAELGLMQSVGFSRGQLSRLVLIENAWLLFLGMLIGIGAALFTTLPHYLVGGATVPWLDLSVMFAVILLAGLVAAWIASRMIARMPLVPSLRS